MEAIQTANIVFEHQDKFTDLTEALGYNFKNINFLLEALTVANLIKKSNKPDKYNALATLGDGFLRAVIDDVLLEIQADLSKGNLSLTRDQLVNNEMLCKIAQRLDLKNYLVSTTSKNIKKINDKILADCLEAVIAAVFLDSERKYKLVKKIIIKLWRLDYLYNGWLVQAVLEKNNRKVKYLLKCGAAPNLKLTDHLFSEQDVIGFKIREDKKEYFVDFVDNARQFATNLFCEVATQNCPDIATLFLDYGADINASNLLGHSPLYNAAYSGHANMVELFCERGAKIFGDLCDGYTPFLIAVHQNRGEIVQIMLDKLKFDINEVTPYGKSALGIATQFGHYQIAKNLIKNGALINIACVDKVNKKFTTAIHIAVENNHINVLELFIKHKANLDVVDFDGNTPLHMAVITVNQNAVVLLVQHGASVEKLNRNGKKPIDLACSQIKSLLKPVKTLNKAKQITNDKNNFFQTVSTKESSSESVANHSANELSIWSRFCSIL